MGRRLRAARHHRVAVPRDPAAAGQAPPELIPHAVGPHRCRCRRGRRHRCGRRRRSPALLVDRGRPVPAAVVGGVNGPISGARGTYGWRSANGPVAFALDSTWGLPMTLAALAAHGVAALQGPGPGYVARAQPSPDRHVYVRGLRLRRGLRDHDGQHDQRCRRIGAHVGPALAADDRSRGRSRVASPLVGSAVPGPLRGVVRRRGRGRCGDLGDPRRDERFTKVVETCAYYLNPFEWWAYSRDGFWPPRQKVRGVGWSTPAVQPFSATSRRWGRGRAGSRAAPR